MFYLGGLEFSTSQLELKAVIQNSKAEEQFFEAKVRSGAMSAF